MFFFYKKTTFLPEPEFSEHNARNVSEILKIFFLTFVSFFSLILYLIKFNTNNKRRFVNNGDRQEF